MGGRLLLSCDLYQEPEGLTGVAAAREINKVPADRPSAESQSLGRLVLVC